MTVPSEDMDSWEVGKSTMPSMASEVASKYTISPEAVATPVYAVPAAMLKAWPSVR
jgi:hypothetical protein